MRIAMIGMGTIGLAALAFASCSRKTIQTASITNDSIVIQHEVQYRDTLITIPGETITINDTIPCPEANVFREVKQGRTTARLWINKGMVQVDCKTDSLQQIVQMLRRELMKVSNFHKEKRSETFQIAPWYKQWFLWLFIAIGLIAYFYILKLVFKP